MIERVMADLFASGRIIDAILALVACEAVALVLWRLRTGHGPALVPLLCNLTSGAALMLALRGALTGAAWPTIAVCLAASFVAHGIELGLRVGVASACDTCGKRVASEPGTSPESVAFPNHDLI